MFGWNEYTRSYVWLSGSPVDLSSSHDDMITALGIAVPPPIIIFYELEVITLLLKTQTLDG